MGEIRSNPLRRFLSSVGGGARGGSVPVGFHLAVFGKHPGWADFFELGLTTPGLAAVHSTLFEQGIDENIVSGVWGDPRTDLDRIVDGLRHLFVWRQGRELYVGRWWPSRDSVGRRRPVVVCVQSTGLPFRGMLRGVLPLLERLEAECCSVSAKGDVRSAVSATSNDLNRLVETVSDAPDDELSPATLPWFVDKLEAGGGGGLAGVLDELARVCSYASDRAQQLRFPSCGGTPEESAMRWSDLLLSNVDARLPALLLVPTQEDWVDVILGEAGPLALVCIGRSDFELTTEAGIAASPEFSELVSRASADSAHGSGGACLADHVADGVLPTFGSSRGRPRRSGRLILLVAAALGLLSCLLFWLFGS